MLACIELAKLRRGNPNDALAALTEHEGRLAHRDRMEARLGLWELTGERSHLTAAYRFLAELRTHASGSCRASMLENVPLHRDIMRAWEEHGGG